MPTYFMYCRKSSEAEDRQILSIDSQVSELKRYAARRGLKVTAILTEAKSAKAPGARPVFNSMMERLYKGEVDGILCWKLDRLARNPVDGGSIIWAMKQHGVTVVTPFQMYGQSEDNVVWMYLEFGMAQKYVDDLSRNVKRGLRSKAEMGWFPSLPPLGYVNRQGADGRKVIEKDSERFEAIRKCWDLMLTGNHTPAEIRSIATTVFGLKTTHGPIGRTTLYNLLSNPFYHGSYEYPKGSGTWHIGRHIPMVTKEEFDAVQRLLSRSKQMPQSRHVFAFTGLIRCGGCGGAVTAEEKHQVICPECRLKFAHRCRTLCPKCRFPVSEMPKARFLRYAYYHCARSVNPECKERAIEQGALEKQVVHHLRTIKLPDLHRFWTNRCVGRLDGNHKDEGVLDVIGDRLLTNGPEVQRQVAAAVFREMTLKGKVLSVLPQVPFSFEDNSPRESQTSTPA